jgi:hypothetical protein
MIWLTWRQHRLHLAVAAALLLGIGSVFLVLRPILTAYLTDSGLATCVTLPDEGCGRLITGMVDRIPSLLDLLPYLNLLPALAGVFVGAPLVARELERGTQRLVWTQSTSRWRWFATKVGLLLVAAVVVGIAFGSLTRWFIGPYVAGAAVSSVQRDVVGLVGLAPAAYAAFSFALGTAAGAVLRRTLPAMAATLVGFVAVRLGWEQWRYTLLPPRHAVVDPTAAVPVGPARHDWVLPVSPWVSPDGTRIGDDTLSSWCGPAPTKTAFEACLTQHNVHEAIYWEPAARFWTFQWLDIAVFGTAALLLLAFAGFALLRRRG